MFDEKLFREKVEMSGVTITFIAEKVGISREALHRKLRKETEFKVSEVVKITNILKLTETERNNIFFAEKVN